MLSVAVRRNFRYLSGLLFLITFLPLGGFTVPALTGPLVDQAGIFTAGERDGIRRALNDFAKVTGGQLFVAVLKSADGLSPEEIGIKLMEAWKPGLKGKDNGAILVIIPSERKMRLEIGYGWEGSVNDARAGDVIRTLAPFFREQRYADGVLAAVDRLAGYLTGKPLPPVPAEETQEERVPGWLTVLFLIVAIVLVIRYPWLLLFFMGGGRGGGGGFGGGGGGRGGGGGASGGW